MKTTSSLAIILCLCIFIQSTGCSWILMKPAPSDYQPQQIPLCGGYSSFVLDTIFAAAFVWSVAYAFQNVPSEVNLDDSWIWHASGNTIISAVFLASGTTGFLWARKCRRAIDSREAWLEKKAEERVEIEEHPDSDITED